MKSLSSKHLPSLAVQHSWNSSLFPFGIPHFTLCAVHTDWRLSQTQVPLNWGRMQMNALCVGTTHTWCSKSETPESSPVTESFLMQQHHLRCQVPLMSVSPTRRLYSASATVVFPGIILGDILFCRSLLFSSAPQSQAYPLCRSHKTF